MLDNPEGLVKVVREFLEEKAKGLRL